MTTRTFMHCFRLLILVVLTAAGLPPLDARSETIVTDAAGRRVGISEPVCRVVTTFKPATLFMLSLADPKILAGVHSNAKKDPLVLAIAPEIGDLPGVGSKSRGLSMEAILGLKPDLVVLYAHKDGMRMAQRLARSDIPAIMIKPETFDSMRDTIYILAAATGRQDRAQIVIDAIDNILDQVSSRVADINPGKRKNVYYATPRGFLSTAPADMLQDQIIELSGGVNVASHLYGYFKNISAEDLIKWRPDVITISRPIRTPALEMLQQHAFSLLPAVENGDVYVFPSSLTPWDFPSPLSALAVLWLGSRMYPERFADISVMDSVNAFHQNIFGKSMSKMGGHLDDRIEGLAQVQPKKISGHTGADKTP